MRLLAWGGALAYLVAEGVFRAVARDMLARGAVWAVETDAGYVGVVPSTNAVLAFSFPVPNAVIWPVGIAVGIALVVFLVRARTTRERVGFGIILLGAAPNLVDRIAYGGVTDYVALTNLFPAFNIADLLIFAGVGVLILARGRPRAAACGTPAR